MTKQERILAWHFTDGMKLCNTLLTEMVEQAH